ncbi:RNA polymerase sigma factor SigJ [Streptosporangiaceae bacterium NEAU-GS5]|nr:RNA polymerase sigma factor SigJ [Streptosporangiaceae bacterium NEAU-GS5]
MAADAGDVAEFEAHRRRLFGLAYRMLGSAAEAEDVVQDAYLRWRDAAPDHPTAWLTKVVTNLCRTRLTSSRATRETYIGPWLPEPVAAAALGPLETAEQRESVSIAFLVMLERLTPAERAVVVLREAFSYGYREIAGLLDLTEANCRQLYGRASRRLHDRPRFADPDLARWKEIVARFIAAAQEGDLAGLEKVLAEDVVAWTDGGGALPAARKPVEGRAKVARWASRIVTKFGAGYAYALGEVNGQPAIIATLGGRVAAVVVIDLDGDLVARAWTMVNPAKLSQLGPVASL